MGTLNGSPLQNGKMCTCNAARRFSICVPLLRTLLRLGRTKLEREEDEDEAARSKGGGYVRGYQDSAFYAGRGLESYVQLEEA